MRCLICLFVTLSVSFALGCQPPAPPAAGTDDHGHDHGHAHAHGHSHEDAGPHGGHLVELGDEEYHVEWLHDDESGLVTVYILDGEAQAEVPIEAAQITIDVVVGENARQHQLAAVSADEGVGSARFELTDKSLIEVLKIAGPGAEATITVEIAGQSYTGRFEHHAH